MTIYKLPEKYLTVKEIDELTDFLELANVYEKKNIKVGYAILNKLNEKYKNCTRFESLGISINLTKFFLKTSTEIVDYFKYLTIDIFKKKRKVVNMFLYFKNILTQKKVVYVSLDVFGYGHTEGEDYPYDTHSIILMFIPLKKNYKLLVLNPHGRDLTYDYEVIFSTKRIKKINYPKGIDWEYINMFISNMNTYLKKSTNVIIEYNNTTKTFYRGVNLQSGDSRGYCYLLPIVFFHYFRVYYNKTRLVDGIKFDSTYSLLKRGKFDYFVANCLVDYCKRYKEKIMDKGLKSIKKNYDDFENIIISQDFRLFKKMASKHLIRCEDIFWEIEDDLFN